MLQQLEMKFYKLNEVGRDGWFIGDYPNASITSKNVEVCYREYPANYTQPHYHTVCEEIVLVVDGIITVGGRTLSKGDVVVIEQGETNDIFGVTDYSVVGVKMPAGGNDKVLL